MNRFFLLAITLIFAVSFSLTILAQEKTKDESENKTFEQKSDSSVVFNTVCPVSTEEADPEITYTYKGKTYALCCKNCLKKFKNDPEKYISRLSEDGKSIKKKKE